ncbi:hypothetical protein G8S55_08875 [Clostridium botulinum C]|uniref:hypothetical protein n=1 Tax=Clostridium botulinum TaxID=1491 RepID=UPI001E537117|nr:hypothetical protein [Clostridium botulinum]MCD3217360.1 hypothetical protein [Clostridium botulinum C]
MVSLKEEKDWDLNSNNINQVMEDVIKSGNTGANIALVIAEDSTKEEVFNFGKVWGKALRSPYFYIDKQLITMEKYQYYKDCCQQCKKYQKEKRNPSSEELKSLDVYQIYILGRLCWDL